MFLRELILLFTARNSIYSIRMHNNSDLLLRYLMLQLHTDTQPHTHADTTANTAIDTHPNKLCDDNTKSNCFPFFDEYCMNLCIINYIVVCVAGDDL